MLLNPSAVLYVYIFRSDLYKLGPTLGADQCKASVEAQICTTKAVERQSPAFSHKEDKEDVQTLKFNIRLLKY